MAAQLVRLLRAELYIALLHSSVTRSSPASANGTSKRDLPFLRSRSFWRFVLGSLRGQDSPGLGLRSPVGGDDRTWISTMGRAQSGRPRMVQGRVFSMAKCRFGRSYPRTGKDCTSQKTNRRPVENQTFWPLSEKRRTSLEFSCKPFVVGYVEEISLLEHCPCAFHLLE